MELILFSLLLLLVFVVEFVVILSIERKIRAMLKNKVHFYVARDKDGTLWLYLSKPRRLENNFSAREPGNILTWSKYFSEYGISVLDFVYLKWEDEPVEVFLNLE